MSDSNQGMARLLGGGLSDGQSKLAIRVLAGLLALLTVWFAWSGVRQWRADAALAGVERARDAGMASIQQVLEAQQGQLARRLAEAPVQAALAAGDRAAAAAAIAAGWAEVEAVDVLPATLEDAYAQAEQFGFGRLALMEAALESGAPVTRIVRDQDGPRWGLAAAVGSASADADPFVVYVRLPLQVLVAGLDQAALPGSGYLALRQGRHSLHQRGDGGLSEGAEALARPIGESGLRVAAAAQDSEPGPFGLAARSCLIAAGVLGALVLLLLVLGKEGGVRWLRRTSAATGAAGEEGAQTLRQALLQDPPPAAAARATPAPTDDALAVAATTEKPRVDPGIFRAYDIRGVVGRNLSPAVASLIGQAIGARVREQGLTDVVVGRDGRLSGPELADGLIEGLRRTGCNVIDIGLAATPLVYFATYHLRTGSGVAVTGSHNPPDYNGFKIVIGGETLSGDAITDLYHRIAEGSLPAAAEPGGLQQRDVADDYIQRIADDVQLDRPLKVVADAGNGVAGDIAPRLLEAIGAEVIPLYCDVDGTFPNHHPDPSEPHNLEDLIQTVKRFDADLGVAFDGDGDRLGVVTPAGEMIFPDRLLMLFAADVLMRNPGAQIIYDVKCTGKLSDYVLRHGGSPLMWRTGHSLIKAKMRETEAELAGEMSGHFFFKERWYGFDDGLYAAARLLEILAMRDESAGEVLGALPAAVSTPEIKVDVPDGDPHAVVARFVQAATAGDDAESGPGSRQGARLSTIDGLRADWSDGWGLLRASNTTPVLVLRFEADDEAALRRIRDTFRERLVAIAPGLLADF